MRILDWDTLDSGQRRAALARPQLQSLPEVTRVAREVIASVRQSGDEALHCLTRRFDAVELDALSVAPAEFAQARRSLARGQIAALERAITNVHAFHAAQLPQPLALDIASPFMPWANRALSTRRAPASHPSITRYNSAMKLCALCAKNKSSPFPLSRSPNTSPIMPPPPCNPNVNTACRTSTPWNFADNSPPAFRCWLPAAARHRALPAGSIPAGS